MAAVRVVFLILFLGFSARVILLAPQYREWKVFGGGPDNIHYSTLSQIARNNVSRLAVAWSYDTGDAFPGSEMQCNPVIVDGNVYFTSPKLKVIALDGATGALKWSFDPVQLQPDAPVRNKMRNRGVTVWENGNERRLYFAFRQFLYSLDARTGVPDSAFGRNGRVDLREGLGRDVSNTPVSASTPGVIFKDLLILGSIVSEGLPAAPGHIRAFDLRTGKIRWTFRTIPNPGELGYETWPKDAWQYIGAANNWGGMALDERRGLVFVPTGSAAFDFYGANRHGDNLFANSLLCLDATTGKRIWHFQFIKHDVWDRDLPTAPSLVTLRRNGRTTDAVAQITKSGHVFVFDRETGKSLFPIEYRKVPPSTIDGELLAKTQPFPLEPPPFARQMLTEADLTNRTPAARAGVVERFKKLRSNGQFEPPSFEGTVVFPGLDGGGEWGGAAFDPETGILYVNSNEMAFIVKLIERRQKAQTTTSESLYVTNCASCHRRDLRGTPPEFPSLVTLKLGEREIETVIRRGVGRMPGFGSTLNDEAISAITRYVARRESVSVTASPAKPSPIDLKYTLDGYVRFVDHEGYPAVAPPWGTLNAIDLNRGKLVWQIPFGSHPGLPENTGSENYGGAVVTSTGLLFIGATNYDKKFRAYDKTNGKVLWETTLPAAGNATPSTYEISGRQFVVIAAGGGKWGAPSGGSIVAFALPER
jgi:glucose dehydrogenase